MELEFINDNYSDKFFRDFKFSNLLTEPKDYQENFATLLLRLYEECDNLEILAIDPKEKHQLLRDYAKKVMSKIQNSQD